MAATVSVNSHHVDTAKKLKQVKANYLKIF